MTIRLYLRLGAHDGGSTELALPRGSTVWSVVGLAGIVPEQGDFRHGEGDYNRSNEDVPGGASLRWVRFGSGDSALGGSSVGGTNGTGAGNRGVFDEEGSSLSGGPRLARLVAQFSPLLRRLGSLPIRNAFADIIDAVDRSDSLTAVN
jgi:hypothetical protein